MLLLSISDGNKKLAAKKQRECFVPFDMPASSWLAMHGWTLGLCLNPRASLAGQSLLDLALPAVRGVGTLGDAMGG